MKTIILTLLVSAVTFVAVAADSAFDCSLTSDRKTYTVGEVPTITVSITNKSGKEVVLVGSLNELKLKFTPKSKLTGTANQAQISMTVRA